MMIRMIRITSQVEMLMRKRMVVVVMMIMVVMIMMIVLMMMVMMVVVTNDDDGGDDNGDDDGDGERRRGSDTFDSCLRLLRQVAVSRLYLRFVMVFVFYSRTCIRVCIFTDVCTYMSSSSLSLHIRARG